MVEFNPTLEIREGVAVVWQIPPNPKAILYLAHSANGSPFSYWPSHPNVPECTGTPEHKVVTRDALERGFAVIASKSVTNEWETWPPWTVDIQNCVKILKVWRDEHGLENLPLSAWGTSCGGDYVSSLAIAVKMHSLIVMISHGHPEAFKSAVLGEYPATLFVPMIRDEKTYSQVKDNIEILREKGIPCAIQEAPPLEVHPHFLAEHIDELDKEQSAKLHSLFVEHGIVAEDNSLNRVLLKHEVEPYLRTAGILPTADDFQRQQDGEKLDEAKKLQAEGRSTQVGGRGPGGGRAGGRGPPPPGGGRVGGRGPPPPGGGRVGGRGPPPPGGGRAGDRGPPPGGRANGRGPPPGGRGGGGPKLGAGPPPSHPLANGISNQLIVAQGNHTLTSRHNKEVFAWLEGKGWPNAQPK